MLIFVIYIYFQSIPCGSPSTCGALWKKNHLINQDTTLAPLTYALVSALVETVLGSLNSAVVQEIGLAWGLKNELNSLESILDTVQLVLQDAESKQRKDEALQNWLRKLKNAAYDAENLLDQIATEGLRRRVASERGKLIIHKLNSILSLRNPLVFRFRIAHKVKNIRERLDAIAEERLKFHLREGIIMDHQVGSEVENRHTSSLVNESEIYGRHEEKEIIVEKLLDDMNVENDLSVYAICGMGGIGKTTLAQLVYNDERVDRQFDMRIWVCVSDDFSIHRLIRAIIESTEGGGCNISELDPLQRLLQERLRGKRFLLVLDDVWNENSMLWDRLREALRCGSKGSVVMVTTRIEKVATMMAAISIHNLRFLSEDDSWSLFRRRAFAIGEVDESLKEIGKGIVKKCGGVPLAVKALGSLMRYKSSESEWLAIKESDIWHLSDDDNGILPALRLSYDNLPLQMRQCFSYCCIFPKDYVMEEDHLIQLWMANGFIPSEGQTDLRLTGHLIFKELIWRSFFQDVKKNSKFNVVCKMHDLVHDLAVSVMRHETYIVENVEVLKFPKTLHHLSFCLTSWEENKGKLKLPINKSLRSLVDYGGPFTACVEGFWSFLSKQRYLRVLDLNYSIIEKMPNFIYKMEHLRFLTFECDNLKKLPESLTCLHNLQTLKLLNSEELLELPKGLKYMKNLRFLDIERCYSLLCTPPGLGELTCLQKLSIFIVGQDSAHQIGQLKDLNLGGDLTIKGLEHIRNFESAKIANLMTKKNLTSLALFWTKGIEHDSAEHFEEILEGLQPNQNIEKIHIQLYQGSRFPNWMSTLFINNLKEISLEQCERCKHLPPLGKLPSLACLSLIGLKHIKSLNVEWHGDGDGESSFPALTRLLIMSMPNLEEWTKPDSVQCFPCLLTVEIFKCPKLTGIPFLPTIKELSISSDNNTSFLKSTMFLTSLTSLRLQNMPGIDILPEGLFQNHKALERLVIGLSSIRTISLDNLYALKRLILLDCSNLEVIPEGLNSLESLNIMCCDRLISFPATILQGSSSLRYLSINNCKKLINPLSGPLERSSVLQDLLINGCPEMKYIPESVQQLSGLRELVIWDCEGLCSLPNWLGSLQSLSEMKIWGCKNLKSLPDGLQSLKSLRVLEIDECPILLKRCRKSKGKDWPKISHIPNIRIDGKMIQYLDI
ncbi:hypothetical protein ACJIZ3_021574 [Penstemon smallii]|uniref:Disease resistance protein RGA3 n=1 Tax=Penstemon smallii TaxID=265156 RepID=A0ABD3SLU7_9LAMI